MKMGYSLARRAHFPTSIDLPQGRLRPAVRPDRPGRAAALLRQGWSAVQAANSRFRSPKARLAVQVALVLLCLIPIGLQAAKDWGEVSLLAGQVQVSAIVASALALILASFFLPMAMMAFTRGAARRIDYRDSALAYFGSQPMKYLPGSFWILPGRVILLRGLGHEVGLSSAALLFEMITQVLSCSFVASVLIGLAGLTSVWYRNAAWLILAGSLIASVLLLISPALTQRVLTRPSSFREALGQLAEIPLAARIKNLLMATLLYAVMWLLMGVSFYAVMVATAPHLDLALLKVAIGVSALAWLAGFLTPFSPGGVGVREAAIVLLLGPFMAEPQAVMVALLSRVLALAIELAFFAGVWRPLHAPRAARHLKDK